MKSIQVQELDPWQQEVLQYQGDILLCTGRRVGKTYILARKAIDYMAEHKGTPIVMVSLTEDQAMIIMAMALNYARETYPKLIGKGKFKPTLKNLYLNGGRMIIRPVGNTGDSARGYEGGILIVDEGSRMPKQFWIASKPMLITTNGKIWMSSTLFGTDNYFYKRFKESFIDKIPDARFKVFVETTEHMVETRPISRVWTEAQREGAKRILAEDKKEMTPAQYAQEYLAIADINLKQYFSDELIVNRQVIKEGAAAPTGENFLGVDVARHGEDDSILIPGTKINREKLVQTGQEILPKMRLDQQAERIKGLYHERGFSKIYIDTTGIGWGVYDCLLAESEFDEDNVEPLENRKLKTELYANLLRLMQAGQIDLYDNDELFQSFKSIQYEYKDKKIRIFSSGKDHIAEALARLAWCMKEKDYKLVIQSF